MPEGQISYQPDKVYICQDGKQYKFIREFKTCCSPNLYHLESIDNANVYAYDAWGRRLSHLLSPISGFDIIND